MRSRINRHLHHDFDVLADPHWSPTALLRTRRRRPRRRVTEQRTPYPPSELTWRDYAVFLLHVAAEIEHSLMVQYLYAAYSLGGPQVPADQMERIRQWQETILGVAKEEMGHLITVQNVLLLLGAAPSLDRQDYPWDSEFYPFTFHLRPLTLGSLATYVCAESPATWRTKEAKEVRHRAEIAAKGHVNNVGRLYARLIDILADESRVPDSAFQTSAPMRQASWDEFGRGYGKGVTGQETGNVKGIKAAELIIWQCNSRGAAVAALSEVGEQGEAFDHIAADTAAGGGPPVAGEVSHFHRFLDMYREMARLGPKARKLTRNLVQNPRTSPLIDIARGTRGHGTGPAFAYTRGKQTGDVITNQLAYCWCHLFNLRYRILLMDLAHALQYSRGAANGDSPKRGYLINSMFGEMYHLRAIAGRIVQLPAQPRRNQQLLAGPPFEMPYSLRLPDSEVERWRLHSDLYKAAQFQIQRTVDKLSESNPESAISREYLAYLAESDQWAVQAIEKWILSPTPSSVSSVPM